MTICSHTINYRGWEIEPLIDPKEVGDWQPCPADHAVCFAIYPPDSNESSLNIEAYTLETAKAAIDIEIEEMLK